MDSVQFSFDLATAGTIAVSVIVLMLNQQCSRRRAKYALMLDYAKPALEALAELKGNHYETVQRIINKTDSEHDPIQQFLARAMTVAITYEQHLKALGNNAINRKLTDFKNGLLEYNRKYVHAHKTGNAASVPQFDEVSKLIDDTLDAVFQHVSKGISRL